MPSRLDPIEAEYDALRRAGPAAPRPGSPSRDELAAEAAAALDAMDPRGAWIDARGMRGFGKASPEGVYESETFIRNVGILARYLEKQAE
jgi:hypothetical protein